MLYIQKRMKCPYCSSESLRVTNKRESPSGIRRRRECLKCKKRFTTYEKIEREDLYVVKKEKFSREKFENGVEKAFEKRPVSKEQIEDMINGIEENLRKKGKEVKSAYIGELTMRKIKKLDHVAYIRFASVYRDFKDINDFKEELEEL